MRSSMPSRMRSRPKMNSSFGPSSASKTPAATPFKEMLLARTTASVQRCMDAGVAPPGDPATVALDLRTAVIGMLSLRINEPDLPWPPFPEQADRFLSKLVGLAPPAGEATVPHAK